MKVHFFSAGFCSADNSHTYKNAPKGKTVFPAFCALIQHPELGNIVFDTGYSEHFFNATKNFPNRIYRWVAPVTFTKGDSAKDQLESKMGISGEYIDYVIVSHFHGDHIGGLKDFPNARFICSKKAFIHFKNYPRAIAFSFEPSADVRPMYGQILPVIDQRRPPYVRELCRRDRRG
ncbi:MAG: MBL fold metallo-hydrolase, partial [Fluviicola sp.]